MSHLASSLLALALSLLPSTPAWATQAANPAQEESEPRDLSPALEALCETHGVPAMGAVLFGVRDGILGLGVSGTRASSSEDPVEVQDSWHLGSCTKAMTATLVARLVEAGELRWDEPLGDVFGDGVVLHEDWRAVTMIELLTHRSGAEPNPQRGNLWSDLRKQADDPRAARSLIVERLAHPADHERGDYLYSNTGYCLAGAVLEQLLDAPFEELLRREVFLPLGMQTAGYGPPSAIQGHRPEEDRWKAVGLGSNADNPSALAPAGTVHASLEDWARFLIAHLAGAQGEESYLPRSSWRRLHQPIGTYAPGWLVVERSWAGGKAWNHAGSNTMWYCVTWMAPEKGWGLAVTLNAAGMSATKAADQAASEFLPILATR